MIEAARLLILAEEMAARAGKDEELLGSGGARLTRCPRVAREPTGRRGDRELQLPGPIPAQVARSMRADPGTPARDGAGARATPRSPRLRDGLSQRAGTPGPSLPGPATGGPGRVRARDGEVGRG